MCAVRQLLLASCAACATMLPCATRAQEKLLFRDPDLPAERRIDDLLGRMTLGEKIAALSTDAGVPRLGVKGSGNTEGLHGVAQGGPSNWGRRHPVPTTQFPQAVGLGETWDPELVRRIQVGASSADIRAQATISVRP